MSKVNNKFFRIEKKMKVEGNIRFIIDEAMDEILNFVQKCELLQEKEFKEAKLIGFGFFQYPEDPTGTYRVFMHLEVYNLLKKYFEEDNYEDISISLTDIPNDFTKIEEVKNANE